MEATEIIYSYSRAQAIEDGVLVDVSCVAREAYPLQTYSLGQVVRS